MSPEGPFANSFPPLEPTSGGPDAAADLRHDPLTGRQVIIAPGRSQRPQDGPSAHKRSTRREKVVTCPFCPGNERMTPDPVLTLQDQSDPARWAVRVVPNLFPLVTTERAQPGSGRVCGVHEVVIETRAHNQELSDRDVDEAVLLLEAIARRIETLEATPGVRQVSVFKNRGLEAGTSLEHPHSQIVALDFVPQEVSRHLRIARRYLRNHGDCLVCAMIEAERQAGARIVFEDESFVALAPYASLSAGETLLVPKDHAASILDSSLDQRVGLAHDLITLLRRTRAAFSDPAYNLMLQTAPRRLRDDSALHWYWRLTPRLTKTAGFEIETGLSVNPLAPADTAARLRAAE